MDTNTREVRSLELVKCDLCGSDSTRLPFEARDWNFGLPGKFKLVECKDCGLNYLNPRPSVGALGQYYPGAYYTHQETPRCLEPVDDQGGGKSIKRYVKNTVKSVLAGSDTPFASRTIGRTTVALFRHKFVTASKWGLTDGEEDCSMSAAGVEVACKCWPPIG